MAAPQKHPADEVAAALARMNGMLTMLNGVYDAHTTSFVTGIPFVHETVQAMEILISRATDALTVMYQTCDLTVVRDIPVKRPPVVHKEEPPAPEPSKLARSTVAFEEASRFAAEAKARAHAIPSVIPEDMSVNAYPVSTPPAALQSQGDHYEPAPARAAVTPPAPVPAARGESYMNAFGPSEQPAHLTDRVEKTLAPLPVAPPPKPLVTPPVNTEARAQSYEELLRKISDISHQAHSEGKAATVDGALLPLVETIRKDLARLRSVA